MKNEGSERCCYYDSKKIPTIGIGFNLNRSDARSKLQKYNLALEDVLEDCQLNTQKACLKDNQIEEIFNEDYRQASNCAAKYADKMPAMVHAALTDVALAGCKTLNQFIKMKKALAERKWILASNELKRSKWCGDVRSTRCNLNANCIASGN